MNVQNVAILMALVKYLPGLLQLISDVNSPVFLPYTELNRHFERDDLY
jgi:hypothetical protein